MIFRLILFLGIFLTFLLGGHFAVYYSVIRFFGVTDTGTKTLLLWITFLLALSFFLSAFLIRLHGNPVFSAYYLFSAFWIGLLVQFLLAVALLWILEGVSKLVGIEFPMFHLASVFFGLAFVVAMIGAWNAAHPVVHNIEARFKNLPASWEGKTVIQLSDVHLGAIHGRNFMQKIADKINTLNPSLVLITGDLLDGMDGDFSGLVQAVDSMKPEKGIYFVTGNHEGYLGLDIAKKFVEQTTMRDIDGKVEDIDGLQLVGVPYPLFDHISDPKAVFDSPEYDPAKPTILMYHTPTNVGHQNNSLGYQQTTAYWTPDTDTSYAREKGVDLQLSGHTHRGQFPPFQWFASLIFRGRSYGLFKDGPFQLYVSSGVGTWGPPIRLFTQSEIVAITLKSA